LPDCKDAKFLTLTAAREDSDGNPIYRDAAHCYERLKKEPAYMVQINMNPFQFPQMVSLATWVRAGFAFFFVVGFAVWAREDGSKYIQALPQIQQAKGNAVAGGTGAQATALIAAGLITVAVGTAIVALFTWVSFDFGLGAVTSYMDVNPFNGGGVVAGACGCLISSYPWADSSRLTWAVSFGS